MTEHELRRRDGSFIIRIWWEQGGGRPDDGHWRGWAQHVRDGRHIYFTSLRALADFIEHETGMTPAEAQASGLV